MIGIFNDNFPPILDGVALTAKNYADWLKEKGRDVCVVTPYAPKSQKVIREAKYPIYRYYSVPIPMRKPYRYGLPLTDLKFMWNFLLLDFEIIHAHCPFTSGTLARLASWRQKIPLVATFHSKYRQDFERVLHSKRLIDAEIKNIINFYNRADEVWIPQAAVEPTLREYGYKGHVEVVENGNDFVMPLKDIQELRDDQRRHLRLKPKDLMLLFVGQHIWEKNIGFTLEALAQIPEVPFHLYMIGTGYAEHAIKEKIKVLGLSEKITMVGALYDRLELKKYYAAADLFVFPSLYDNAPLVVREAAALHTPSLLIKESTAAEVVEDGKNGFLSDNNIASYAGLIRYLADHPELVTEAGNGAAETLARTWENIIDEVMLRYADIQRSYKLKHGH